MFERFGEMDYDGLISLAANLKAEGDTESLKALGEENGLDPEDVNDYIAGDTDRIASKTAAMIGRIQVLEKGSTIMQPEVRKCIYTMAEAMATQDGCDAFRDAVMRPGARIDKVYKKLEQAAKKNQKGSVGYACGTDRDLQKLIAEAVQEK